MIGERIRKERVRLELNQSDMADLAGVGKRTMIDWEKDRSSPTAQHLLKLSAGGVDTSYILTGIRTSDVEMHISQKLTKTAQQFEQDGDIQRAGKMLHEALNWQEGIIQRAETALKRKEKLREINFMLCSLPDDDFEEALDAVGELYFSNLKQSREQEKQKVINDKERE